MKNSLINVYQRHADILDRLKLTDKMSTEELAEKMAVSLSTIRRDLNVLEEKNQIIRSYGFCSYNRENNQDDDKTGPDILKNTIANVASTFVEDYNTVFINSSSTAINSVNHMKAEHLTVVTNNLKIASQYNHPSTNTFILAGGEIRLSNDVLVGNIAMETIGNINADVCIIGCNGVDVENGVTTKMFHEAKINELMIHKTTKCKILVADYRKIGTTSKFKVSDLTVFDYLITDKYCPKNIIKKISNLGVQVIQAS